MDKKNKIINQENEDIYNIFKEEKNKNKGINKEINPLFDINNSNIFKNEYKKENNKKRKNILPPLIGILTLVSVCIVVLKTFTYGKKINEYEEFFTIIEKKDEESIKITEGKEIDSKILKKVAATELIKCLNSKIEINNLPKNINNIINEINNYYNSSLDNFAYTYKDIYTGFTISYNANQSIFGASSIKAPKDIYIYEMASQGKINLDEQLTYTPNYYNTGSGVLKNKPVNTSYSVRTLLGYSTIDSDNAAHNMLMDRFGRENILKFWQAKGTNTIFTQNTNWGPTSAHDATIYMEELYKFYASNEEYGTPLMNNFLNSYPKFIKGKNNYKIASKSGWTGSSLHEISIVFANNPYIVVALSNRGDKEYESYFNTVNELTNRLHEEYWKYKIEQCNSIKQY